MSILTISLKKANIIFKCFALIICCCVVIAVKAQTKGKPKLEVDYVNSFIGTAEDGAGGLNPNVGPPFAMTNFTAQTSENMISKMPYVYEEKSILGFIATHQPTVWMGDYGYVSVMPGIGDLQVIPGKRKLAFSHTDEVAHPYYYSVKMKTAEGSVIKGEIAATERCGILKFTYPKADKAHLVIQALNIDDNKQEDWFKNLMGRDKREAKFEAYIHYNKEKNEITGYNPDRASYINGPELKNFKGYFVIQFSKPIQSFGVWNNDSVLAGKDGLRAKKRLGAYISFATKNNETVKVKIATSFISIDQARDNLSREIPGWDFDRVCIQTRDAWQKDLGRIKVEGITDEQKIIFYSSYYRCLLFPRIFSEYGRYYSAFDDTIHNGVSYNDYSLWDTFRALHPFLIFAKPELIDDMITSLLQMYKEGGWLPMWPNPTYTNIMIGTHADAVIGDAYVKGFKKYDVNLAYEAIRKNAMMPNEADLPTKSGYDRQPWTGFEGRAGLPFYHSLGYVPCDYKSESVSRTLEYALDDYCVAQVAKGLGKDYDYQRLMSWTQNYKNQYNAKSGFMEPRKYNGDWDTTSQNAFTEGSKWTYLFCVMQDFPGLIDLMGGKANFAKMLDRNFKEGHYAHDNEPGHHYIYLYDYCGQPWKTQELIREHVNKNYHNRPNGINGNDDCGQMSAWYIFGVMGFYPVTAASGVYAIGAPQFPKITMKYATAEGSQRELEILANNLSEKNKYVQKVSLDGKNIDKPFITHSDLIAGKKLVFEMGPEPNLGWK